MQVHNRYLIAESEDGVMVIDQHALHERILYEQLRDRVLAGTLETQRLLVPEAVDLSPAEAAAALENQELLANWEWKFGLRRRYGAGFLAIRRCWRISGRPRCCTIWWPVAGRRQTARPARPDGRTAAHDRLQSGDQGGRPAHARGGRRAGGMRHLAEDSHHCPHGRPTALIFTREELDRQFLRT